jgi:hypothetical protein
MTHHEEDELSPHFRTGDAAEEPLEQDREDVADQIEEAVTEARSPDPRVAQPPEG